MDVYGIIGHPLGHSFSKSYFEEKFRRENLACIFHNFDIDNINLIRQIISDTPRLKGFTVTIPYKELIMPLLDSVDKEALAIGAVNVVKVVDGKLIGYNTDVVGFDKSLREALYERKAKKALVLGTGGASKAVLHVLKRHNITTSLVSRLSQEGILSYDVIDDEVIRQHTLIINTTPLGMYPHVDTFPSIPYGAITTEHILIDLVYNPEETAFMRRGRKQGARTMNGILMLHAQAEEAWRIWNNEKR